MAAKFMYAFSIKISQQCQIGPLHMKLQSQFSQVSLEGNELSVA